MLRFTPFLAVIVTVAALAQTPPPPEVEVTDKFLKEFEEGKIEAEMIDRYGVGFTRK